jgi:hypothetical protein
MCTKVTIKELIPYSIIDGGRSFSMIKEFSTQTTHTHTSIKMVNPYACMMVNIGNVFH